MYQLRIAAIIVCLAAVTAAAADTPAGDIRWVTPYDSAVVAAKQAGRNLVVQFFTPT